MSLNHHYQIQNKIIKKGKPPTVFDSWIMQKKKKVLYYLKRLWGWVSEDFSQQEERKYYVSGLVLL